MSGEVAFQNDPVDPAVEFRKQQNHFFVAERAASIDPIDARGEVLWKRMSLIQRVSYHQVTLQLEDYAVWEETPEEEYPDEQAFPFAIDFVTSRCVRVRVAARPSCRRQPRSSVLRAWRLGRGRRCLGVAGGGCRSRGRDQARRCARRWSGRRGGRPSRRAGCG